MPPWEHLELGEKPCRALRMCCRHLAFAWEGDPELVTGMVPGRYLKSTTLYRVWINRHRPRQLHGSGPGIWGLVMGHCYPRPHRGDSKGSGNDQGMAWTRIAVLKLPGFPEWATAPFHLPSGALRSLVTHTVRTTCRGLGLWEQLQEGRERRHGCHWWAQSQCIRSPEVG